MQFSEDQEMRFTEGDCWLLALEMQALEPRLRVAVIGDRSVGSVDDWIHVGVCTENGLFMDIYGVYDDANALKDRWGRTEFALVPEGQEKYWFADCEPCWEASRRDVRRVAEELLNLL